MKVLILTTSYPAYKGHIQSPFISSLCEALGKKVDVDVVCPFYKISNHKEEVIDNVKIHRFKYWYSVDKQTLTDGGGIPSRLKESHLAKLQFPFFFLAMLLKARKYVKECDTIYCQWTLSGLAGVILKKIYKKPLALTTRGAGVNLALKSKIMKKVLMYVFNNCDYITPNNEDHKKTIIKLGIDENKIKTINNGVDKSIFKPLSYNVRQSISLNNENKILLYVGWLIERKGLNYLLDAMPEIINRDPSVQLLVIGKGQLEDQYREQTEKLNIKSYVNFLGNKHPLDVAMYMNASDMLILPSLSEGKPNVVREAMSCGLPVIATKTNGTEEFITDEETGLFIKTKSSKDIKDKVLRLLNNPKDLEHIKLNCVLVKTLPWDESADEYINICEQITNKKK